MFLLQEVVKDLAQAVMQELIIELAASGTGSLDYVREDSQIDFGTPNVNLTYGGEGVSTHDV